MTKTAAAKPHEPAITALDRVNVDKAVEEIRTRWIAAANDFVFIGRLVIDTCFGGDDKRCLESAARREPVYQLLLRKTDALGIGLSDWALSLGVRVAAYNKLVPGTFWKVLDPGRKEELLPLANPPLMHEGAQFAIEKNASRRTLKRWVDNERRKLGKPVTPRGMTAGAVARTAEKLAKTNTPASLVRVEREAAKLTKAGRRAAKKKIDGAIKALQAMGRIFDN